jgi:hypothetical protein
MMHRFLTLFLINVCMMSYASSQGVAVGDWRDHLPYSTVTSVAVSTNYVYAATPYSLFYYDVEMGSVTRLSKVEGLSDIGITSIAWSSNYSMLVVTYSDANIDLLFEDGTVYNIPDIKRKNIPGNKTINRVVVNDRYAWLACGFGIVLIDLQKKEIKDTYYIGANGGQIDINDIAFDDTLVYAATNAGIYSAYLNSPNLAYFGNWDTLSSLPHPEAPYSRLLNFDNKIFAVLKNPAFDDDTLYYLENNTWNVFPDFAGVEISGINTSRDQLIISGFSFLQLFDQSLSSLGTIFTFNGLVPTPNSAEYSPDGVFLYIGDQNHGLVKNWNIWGNEIIKPQGPFSASTFSLSGNGGSISGVAGGYNESWTNLYHAAELFVFNNETWDSYYSFNVPNLDTLRDLVCVQVDPSDPKHVFAGSLGQGLVELRNGTLANVYNVSNSSLASINGYPAFVRVAGLRYDNDGNLWITTVGSSSFLTVLKANGQFKTFSFPSSYSFQSGASPAIDQNGYKWIPLPRGEGVFVFNDNNTIDLTSDDEYKKLTTAENFGALPSLNVNVVAVDKDNEIWIGSDKGIAVIYNPTNVFDGGSYDAQQILVDVGGYVQPLLESENVKCIAVDGANRKWIGTEKGGAFLISQDGTEEVFHFTTENSPLLSDNINGISIEPTSGEVFFATSEGIISFRSTATEPSESLDSILVFPNPVMADFSGYVSISALVDDAWVSITDMYGNLIYRTRALGGQAVWNGLDMDGTKPATGVYLVFISNNDGSLTKTTKLMFYH